MNASMKVNMKVNNPGQNALFYIRLVLMSICGAVIGGAEMAAINLFIELLKSNTVFKWTDLFSISLAHMLIWSILGAIVGITWAIYSFFRHRVTHLSLFNIILYYTFISTWLILVSYININILPQAFSKISLAWNSMFLIGGIILFSVLIKYLGKLDVQKFPLFLKLYLFFLVIIHIGSFVMNLVLFQGENTAAQAKKVNNANNLNAIIILLDAVRYDHLSCSGYSRPTSPNIDNIAAQGTLFDNAFSQSSHTQESVSCLFTSTYSYIHNVNTLTKALPGDIFTIPFIFKLNGYKTAVFSSNPNITRIRGFNKGVDDFYCLQSNIHDYTLLYYLLTKTACLKIPLLSREAKQVLDLSDLLFQGETSIKSGDPVDITQKVISWIQRNRENPFFIYIHYPGGHNPYRPPAPYNRVFDPGFTGKPVDWYPKNWGMFLPFVEGNAMNPRELQNMIAQYDGQILYHDGQLGKLFKYLKEAKIADKTLLVITADHGEEFYEHQGWGHGHSLFDELIHIPLIFHCPGLIPAHKKITELASEIDIFPTLINLCGLNEKPKLPYPIDGVDLSAAILSGETYKKREFIFAELSYGGTHWAKCLRSKNYKAIIAKFGGQTQKCFFNLETDPFERDNIFSKEMPAGEKYFRMIDDIVKRSYKFKAEEKTLDERTKDRLRSLGYLK